MPMICRKPWITITCLSTPLTSPIRAQSVIFECNSHNCLSTIALMNLAWLPQAHIYISRSSPNSQWAHIRAHLHEISGLLLPLPKSQSMRAYLLHPDCSHADGTRFVCICTWWHNLIYLSIIVECDCGYIGHMPHDPHSLCVWKLLDQSGEASFSGQVIYWFMLQTPPNEWLGSLDLAHAWWCWHLNSKPLCRWVRIRSIVRCRAATWTGQAGVGVMRPTLECNLGQYPWAWFQA